MKTLRRDFLPGDLRPLIRGYGVDGTIAVQARQCEEETVFLLNLAEQNPDVVMGVVGWLDLRADDVEEKVSADSSLKCSWLSTRRTRSWSVFVTLYALLSSLMTRSKTSPTTNSSCVPRS